MTAAQRPWAAAQLLHCWFHELHPKQGFGRFARRNRALRRERTLAQAKAMAEGNAR